MADQKISALAAVTTPASTDVVPIVSGGATKKVTIADLVANAGFAGSGLVLLEQHTAAASAALTFSTTFTSTYDDYHFDLVGILPVTNAVNLLMEVSTDGGSSWSNSTYHYTIKYSSDAAVNSATNSAADSSFLIAGTLSNLALGGTHGSIRAFNPLSASAAKTFGGKVMLAHSDTNRYMFDLGLWWVTATAVNAVRFRMSSGNIASGVIRSYGVAK